MTTPTPTPLEAVARALCKNACLGWSDEPDGNGDYFRDAARAAIEALPVTEVMVVAAYNELHDDFTAIPNKMLRAAIAAAIRAALSEGQV